MKVPLNWLRDYVDLSLAVPQLVERLTLAGLEVGGVRLLGVAPPEGLHVKAEDAGPIWDRDKIVVAQIVNVEKHPNADKLKLPTVDLGGGRTKTMVTGAPNINVGDSGQKVIVALSGSVLYDGHSETKKLSELKPTKIRGVPSDAMVCSAYELGISDEHEGIILLEADAPVGTPLVDFMGDIVLDIDVLPNMARCLSMLGVAREVAAITGQKIKLPKHAVEAAGDPIEGQVRVVIDKPELSARYAAMLLKGVTIGPSPGWMQRRLNYAGMRPISNIVDITNYVMLEWGQPLHAFDWDLLLKRAAGKVPTITVRPAKAGEVLVTLDNQRRELSPDDLVIADTAGAIALAGVMGGAETEVSATTKNVLLESANFDFVSIRRTMRKFELPSEASQRFSKGIHPETVKPAAERASELMRQYAGAKVCRGMADCYPAPLPPLVIDLDLAEVRRILGIDFPAAEAARILQGLEFTVEQHEQSLRVTAPPHRRDMQEGKADLIEELARIHGYDKLPATLLSEPLPEQRGNPALALEERTRDVLVRCGLQEVITYALTTPERETPLGLPAAERITLANPISSERAAMRHSVLAGVLDVAVMNLKHCDEVRLFEIGSVYLGKAGEKLPAEPRRLGLVLTGRRWPEFWGDGVSDKPASLDFFDLKGVVEALAADLHVPDVSYRRDSVAYLHPGQAAELLIGGKPAGTFGELHPHVAAAFGKELTGRTVLAGELDLETILAAVPDRYVYRPLSTFPPALRDVAVIVPDDVTAEKVAAEIRAAGGDLLCGVRLFDLYRGDSIPAGTKSLAFALTYQANDRTLTDKEVDKAHEKIEKRLVHVLKAQIRGKT